MLIQSLFLDRKDELQEMQKVLWHIVDINKTNADIQIKAREITRPDNDSSWAIPYTTIESIIWPRAATIH